MIRTLVVNYQHTNVTEKPVYYRSSCSIALSISNIRNGTHDVTVTMYPNITGNDTDIFFGTNKTYKIDLEQQGLTLRECPQVIEVGAIISCRCEKSHFILKDISIDWYDENQHKILNTSNILRFKVSRNSIKRNMYFI
ncbi:unnamed protein product [Lymnaea stagnalis]|uniref:Uncharacterized protein n=1 Tax=Lymnaea stagnalis TaxID=6523 RepID=A0AAV2HHU6_LYMST